MPVQVGVFLIDDSPPMRELTRLLIEEDDRLAFVGEAQDFSSSLELIEGLEVDVILLDHSLPGTGGLDAIPMLRVKAPDAAILLYSAQVYPALEREAINRGAHGAIEKGGSVSEMCEAIHTAGSRRKR
jgi:DNA-binding NarL/FixJ family response regulator